MKIARASLLVFASFALGCTFKLASMARDDGRSSMDCPDAKWKARFKSAEVRSYIVYGCGKWELYEGDCNGENNGCDHTMNSPDCDGSCRTRIVDRGELEADGSIPEHVLHPNKNKDA